MKLNKEQQNNIYKNERVIAVYSLAGDMGIEIFKVLEDEVIWRYSNEIQLRSSRLKENYTDDEVSYSFRIGNSFINLNECMRVERNENDYITKIKIYFNANKTELFEIVSQINSYDSSLQHLEFLDMEDLDIYRDGLTPTDIANKIFFGDFNPNHEYFRFNGYENLESFDEWELNKELFDNIDEIIERIIDLKDEIELPKEIENILEIFKK